MTKYLLLFFLFFSLIGYSQNKITGNIIYEVSMQKPGFNKKDSLPNAVRNKVNFLLKNARPENFKLIFNKNESKYVIIKRMDSDNDPIVNLSKILGGGNKIFYKNVLSDSQYYQEEFSGKNWVVTYEDENYTLTREEKKIRGFSCYKATFGKGSYVWYTPEIPINFGPGRYNGLPGLVLEVMHKGILFTVKKVDIGTKNLEIDIPSNGKKITEKEYLKMKSKYTGFE